MRDARVCGQFKCFAFKFSESRDSVGSPPGCISQSSSSCSLYLITTSTTFNSAIKLWCTTVGDKGGNQKFYLRMSAKSVTQEGYEWITFTLRCIAFFRLRLAARLLALPRVSGFEGWGGCFSVGEVATPRSLCVTLNLCNCLPSKNCSTSIASISPGASGRNAK